MKLDWNFLLPKNLQIFFYKILKNKNFSHTYFFVGPKGTNKQKTAISFAQSILCQPNSSLVENLPCYQCDHCKQVEKMIHPDLFLVNLLPGSKNISIEQIKELTQKLSLKALVANFKFAIINNAELMTTEAANALLKSLEEPTDKTIFILISENKNSLPQTIISRCQVIRFSSISKQEFINFFIQQNKDKNEKNKDEIDKYYRFSQGFPGLLSDYLADDEIWLKEFETIQNKLTRHSLPLYEKFDYIKKELVVKNFSDEKKLILQKEIEDWIKIFRDVLLIKFNLTHLVRYKELSTSLEKFSKHYNLKNVLLILNQLITLNKKLDLNLNSQLVLENMYLNII